MRKGILQLTAALLLLGVEPGLADDVHPDALYRDRDNENNTLLVFVAGLGGKGSWNELVKLIEQDDDLQYLDYLLYHSPQSLNIEENVDRIKTLVKQYSPSYARAVYVGHSIGGLMIKKSLIDIVGRPFDAATMPSMFITFGTPLETDKFSINFFQRLGASILWFKVSRLKKEVFNLDKLREINTSWRAVISRPPIDDIILANIFGINDSTAPVEHEGNLPSAVFITGDHLGIIKPATEGACSWKVFKGELTQSRDNAGYRDCIRKPPS